jgi:hypothetical protein
MAQGQAQLQGQAQGQLQGQLQGQSNTNVVVPVTTVRTANDNRLLNQNTSDVASTNTNSNVANGGNATATGGVGYSAASATALAEGGAGGLAYSTSANNGNNTGTANVVVQGDAAQERNPVSSATAPTVITGSDQCLVPVAVGGQGIGFGLSIGVAVRDENCEVLKLSRQVEYLVGKDAAIKFLRMNDPRVEALMQALGK